MILVFVFGFVAEFAHLEVVLVLFRVRHLHRILQRFLDLTVIFRALHARFNREALRLQGTYKYIPTHVPPVPMREAHSDGPN